MSACLSRPTSPAPAPTFVSPASGPEFPGSPFTKRVTDKHVISIVCRFHGGEHTSELMAVSLYSLFCQSDRNRAVEKISSSHQTFLCQAWAKGWVAELNGTCFLLPTRGRWEHMQPTAYRPVGAASSRRWTGHRRLRASGQCSWSVSALGWALRDEKAFKAGSSVFVGRRSRP